MSITTDEDITDFKEAETVGFVDLEETVCIGRDDWYFDL